MKTQFGLDATTSDCPKCGAPQGMIGWLCGCWYEGGDDTPEWMKEDYYKKKYQGKQNDEE